jgi:tetratricopeptide (TPR) repeat protein
MDVANDRVDPQPRWPVVVNPFATAADAFAAGNYPLALDMAPPGSALRAAAMVMCGAIAPGLALLATFDSAEMRLVRAYAHWCLDQAAEARKLLESLKGSDVAAHAAALASLLGAPPEIVLVTPPGSSHPGRFQAAEGFRVHSIQLEPERFGISMSEALAALPSRTPPRLILSIDAYGPYLPRALRAPGIPFACWAGDHDFYFANRYSDLARADVIVVNAAGEQVEMARHYGARIAAIPGHETYQRRREPSARIKRVTDIVFTGRAFTPYMRDKAQMLFRLATLADESLSIEITDGYLPEDDYAAALARARNVPVFWRYAGGLQTRAIEALRADSRVLAPESGLARPLLGSATSAYQPLADADLPEIFADPPRGDAATARDLGAVFWDSPAREERFLKFCLFEAIMSGGRAIDAAEPSYTPAEHRAYAPEIGARVYTRVARLNAEAESPNAAGFNHAAAAAFYAAILVPDKVAVAGMALDFYRSGVAAFPDSLALRFNAARAFWIFGLHAEAVESFRAIVEQLPDLSFDARSDTLLSHRIRVLSNMFPYGDFLRAAVAFSEARSRTPGPREFVASASLAYLAMDLLQRNAPAAAVPLLQRAVERCDVHVAAWRLLARAYAAAAAPPAEVRAAFYTAVNLYPGELLDLLPVGIEAELAEGRTGPAARLLTQWVLLRARVRDVDGRPIPAAADAVAAAGRYRALLSDWTGKLLDRMVAAE